MNKKLILQTGQVFHGKGFGANNKAICEIVFNTSMAGYQEIISDNSYTSQAVVMTFPLMGVYGINDQDFEAITPHISALIVSSYEEQYSNCHAKKSLEKLLTQHQVVGISDVDTRAITKIIRMSGSQLCMICDEDADEKEALLEMQEYKFPKNQVQTVSTKNIYAYENIGYKVVCYDFGIKQNILRELTKRNIHVIVVPFDTKFEQVVDLDPDAVFLSNGPADPRDLPEVVEEIKKLQKKYTIFGICLGHQLIGLANNCTITKLKFGHHGGNHPVKNLKTGKVEITSQNHNYAIESIDEDKVEITHINLLDNSIEGIKIKNCNVFSIQYHPESAPGPVDSLYLFDEFIKLIESTIKGE